MLPYVEKGFQKPKRASPLHLPVRSLPTSCEECLEELKCKPLVYLEKKTFNCKLVCDKCLKKAVAKGKTIYYDSLEFYEKRLNTGFFEQLEKECFNGRD